MQTIADSIQVTLTIGVKCQEKTDKFRKANFIDHYLQEHDDRVDEHENHGEREVKSRARERLPIYNLVSRTISEYNNDEHQT